MNDRKKRNAFFDVAFFMALRNILHKKKMLFLIVFIIGLGFFSTIFTGGIIKGLQVAVEDKAIDSVEGNIMVEPYNDAELIESVGSIIKKIRSINGVVEASPRRTGGISFINDDGKKIASNLIIIDPVIESKATIISENMLVGDYLANSGNYELIIGSDITKKYRSQEALPALDIDYGDTITAIFDNGVSLPMKIRGIYSTEFALTDTFVFMTLDTAKRIYGWDKDDLDKASGILIKTRDRGNENEVIKNMKSLGIKGDIWSWKERLGLINQFGDSLLITAKLTSLVGIIISFAVIYIMIYINVIQKRSQIGILKAIGVEGKTILASYVIQSMIYGFLGVIFGIIITALILNYLTVNPLQMPLGDVVPIRGLGDYIYSSVVLFFSSVFAGYFASKGVVNENILDAIFKG